MTAFFRTWEGVLLVILVATMLADVALISEFLTEDRMEVSK